MRMSNSAAPSSSIVLEPSSFSSHARAYPCPGVRLAVTAALTGFALLCACHREAATPVTASRVVSVAKAIRTQLADTMTMPAEFEPYQDILMHGKVSGYINAINVDIGDRVKAGDLIATVEVPELHDQFDAAVAMQKKTEADFQIARLNHHRLSGVNKTQPGLVAQQDLDDAEAKENAAAASFSSAKADADRYRAMVAYTQITAPFSGVITKRFVDLGSLVQAGTSSNSGPIVELAEDDRLRLRFPVPEAETPGLKIGQAVQIHVDALERNFIGKIVRTANDIDRSTRTMTTEVDVENPDGRLKSGMYASIVMALHQTEDVVAIPLQALSSGDKPVVMLVNRQGKLEERPVSVGLRTADQAEIKTGLVEGDRVVMGDRGGLRTGDTVSVKEMDVASASNR